MLQAASWTTHYSFCYFCLTILSTPGRWTDAVQERWLRIRPRWHLSYWLHTSLCNMGFQRSQGASPSNMAKHSVPSIPVPHENPHLYPWKGRSEHSTQPSGSVLAPWGQWCDGELCLPRTWAKCSKDFLKNKHMLTENTARSLSNRRNFIGYWQ